MWGNTFPQQTSVTESRTSIDIPYCMAQCTFDKTRTKITTSCSLKESFEYTHLVHAPRVVLSGSFLRSTFLS